MNTPIYYTYLIKHKVTNKFYYGASYNKTANPSKLWTTYFTSSKTIKSLIEIYGKDSFEVQVRKLFNDPIECLNWETKFLTKIKAAQSDKWLNKHNGAKNFYCVEITKETGRKISKANTGRKNTEEAKEKMRKPKYKGFGELVSKRLKNVPKTQEHRDKLSAMAKNRWSNPEQRLKQSERRKGSIPWNKGLKLKEILT